MALVAVNISCTAGGTTQVRADFEVRRSGSNNDQAQIRIVRRIEGQGDVILPSQPQFVLPSDRDTRGWTFIDVNLPADGVYTYVLQISRINGGGTFYSMAMTAVHFRK